MKGRGRGSNANHGGGASTADLLLCFPSARSHRLSLMPPPPPKAICSPSRITSTGFAAAEYRHNHRLHQYHPKRLLTSRAAGPLLFNKASRPCARALPPSRDYNVGISDDVDEPTSPKVTCAGQIKVRTTRPAAAAAAACERKRRPHWAVTLGIKKDVMQFLTALRGFRFNLGCFGTPSFHSAVVDDCTSDDEEEVLEEEQEGGGTTELQVESGGRPRTVFSKWFMVLEEARLGVGVAAAAAREEESVRVATAPEEVEDCREDEDEEEKVMTAASVAPPPNALLLMRCRSAPARGWARGNERERVVINAGSTPVIYSSKEVEEDKDRMLVMSYAPDFFKVSSDIARETWVVGSMDPLARSRSWRR